MSAAMDFGGSGTSAYDGMCGNCQGSGTLNGVSCGHCGGSGSVHAKEPNLTSNLDDAGGASGAYLGDSGGGYAQPGIGDGLDMGNGS